MSRLWTPYFQPPSPEDMSEFSKSALKVIAFLDQQEYFQSRGKKYSTFSYQPSVTFGLKHSKDVKAQLINASNNKFNTINFLEQTPNGDKFYKHKEFKNSGTFLGFIENSNKLFANPNSSNLEELAPLKETLHVPSSRNVNATLNMNVSVDMFEDTILIEDGNRSPQVKRQFTSSFKATPSRKKQTNSYTKITKYFSAIKHLDAKPLSSTEAESSGNTHHKSVHLQNNLIITSIKNNSNENKIGLNIALMDQKENNYKPNGLDNTNFCEIPKKNELGYHKRFKEIEFENPQKKIMETMRNFTTPSTKENLFGKENDNNNSNNFSLINNVSCDNMNIGQHEESLIEASSYFGADISRLCQETYSQVEIHDDPIEIITISTNNHGKIFNNLTNEDIDEIGMTLCYSEGFSLLNRTTKTNGTPNGLLLCSKYADQTHKMVFFSSECFKHVSLRNFLLHLLCTFTRKICYDAQALILYVLDNIVPDDIRVCYEWCILDPLVGAWLLNPDQPPTSLDDFLKIFPELKIFKMSEDWRIQCCYLLLYQSKIMENIYFKLKNENLWSVFLHLETQIIPLLAVMEASEILVDTEKLKNMSCTLKERLAFLEKEAEIIAGQKLTLNSTTQVRNVLYDKLKLDEVLNIKIKGTSIRGVKSTSEAMTIDQVMGYLGTQFSQKEQVRSVQDRLPRFSWATRDQLVAGPTMFYLDLRSRFASIKKLPIYLTLKLLVNAHPLPSLILEYRQLFKLKSTYTDALYEYAKKKKSISSLWDLCSAATGRVTSSNPNLQAIPKQGLQVVSSSNECIEINLRSCFLARENRVFVSMDFQQIELRIFAVLSQDIDLLELIKKADDIFNKMTQLRLKKTEITEEERNLTKTLVYALMYGAGVKKIAGILSMSEIEAVNIRNTFIRLFPGLSEFNKKILNEARQTKVLHSLSGRKRIFPNILSENVAERKYSERQAINFVIQGSAADICKGAMLRCELELKKKSLNTRLLLQIHDELLWEVREADIPVFKDIVSRTMKENKLYWAKRVNIDIPLPVVIKIGKNWGHMK